MSDPLSFVPLALAAADGEIDGLPCRRLVASGVALLQRSAPLVRALDGQRAAILLRTAPSLLVALAACSGRAALVLEPTDDREAIAAALRSREVGAAFSTRALAASLPPELPRILLDSAPAHASWEGGSTVRAIDLSQHEGLLLEGDPETEGSGEVAVVLADRGSHAAGRSRSFTHRDLLSAARAYVRSQHLDARSHTLAVASPAGVEAFIAGCVAPLLAGGRVSTGSADAAEALLAKLESDDVTALVAPPSTYAAIAARLERRGGHLDAPILQHCVADAPIDEALSARWRAVSAVPIASPAGRVAPAGPPGEQSSA